MGEGEGLCLRCVALHCVVRAWIETTIVMRLGPVALGFLLRLLPRTFGLNLAVLTTINFLRGGDNKTFVAPNGIPMSGTSRMIAGALCTQVCGSTFSSL